MRYRQTMAVVSVLLTLGACAAPPQAETFGTRQGWSQPYQADQVYRENQRPPVDPVQGGGGFYPSYRYMRPDLIRPDRDMMQVPPYAVPYRRLDPPIVQIDPQPVPPLPLPTAPPAPPFRRRLPYVN